MGTESINQLSTPFAKSQKNEYRSDGDGRKAGDRHFLVTFVAVKKKNYQQLDHPVVYLEVCKEL